MDGTAGGNERLMIYLREVEELAEDILSDRQEIVDLDRKRNANREALSALDKQAKTGWKGDATKTWLRYDQDDRIFLRAKHERKDLLKISNCMKVFQKLENKGIDYLD